MGIHGGRPYDRRRSDPVINGRYQSSCRPRSLPHLHIRKQVRFHPDDRRAPAGGRRRLYHLLQKLLGAQKRRRYLPRCRRIGLRTGGQFRLGHGPDR
jgi:hypothetical protein